MPAASAADPGAEFGNASLACTGGYLHAMPVNASNAYGYAVPEPGGVALVSVAFAGLAMHLRRRHGKANR